MAKASAAADMAQSLHQQRVRHVSEELHERIEQNVKTAIETYFLAGQLMAMPGLIAQQPQAGPRTGAGGPRPGGPLPGPGFDPMCLTDPAVRELWRDSHAERDAIDTLWAFDPDRARTLAMLSEIDAALARRDIGYAVQGGGPVFDPSAPSRAGHFQRCPWAPIYQAVRDCAIAGKPLPAGAQFTFDVSAAEVPGGGRFVRRILAGRFVPGQEIDYGQAPSSTA